MADLGHRVAVDRVDWPAAFHALEASGAPFLADADGRAMRVSTTPAGRAILEPVEAPA